MGALGAFQNTLGNASPSPNRSNQYQSVLMRQNKASLKNVIPGINRQIYSLFIIVYIRIYIYIHISLGFVFERTISRLDKIQGKIPFHNLEDVSHLDILQFVRDRGP